MLVDAQIPEKGLSPKDFCTLLTDEVKTGHARLHHPFVLALYEGRIGIDELRVWAREAWGIFSLNVAINTAKLVRCQLSGVHDPLIQKKFVDVIMSEVGYEFFEGAPRRVPGHRKLFLRFAESIGIPADELERRDRENEFLATTVVA